MKARLFLSLAGACALMTGAAFPAAAAATQSFPYGYLGQPYPGMMIVLVAPTETQVQTWNPSGTNGMDTSDGSGTDTSGDFTDTGGDGGGNSYSGGTYYTSDSALESEGLVSGTYEGINPDGSFTITGDQIAYDGDGSGDSSDDGDYSNSTSLPNFNTNSTPGIALTVSQAQQIFGSNYNNALGQTLYVSNGSTYVPVTVFDWATPSNNSNGVTELNGTALNSLGISGNGGAVNTTSTTQLTITKTPPTTQ